MLRRLGAAGAVVAVSALAVGSVGPASSQTRSSDGGDHDLKVLLTTTEEEYVDVGDADFSLGDSYVFSGKLSKSGTKVGHAGGVCTIVSVDREESQCAGTLWLRGGQITVRGLVTQPPHELAVTGGTGAYEGAGGTMWVRVLAGGKESLTLHLVD